MGSVPETIGSAVLVTGAGGFIGHHLVSYLKRQGHWVRGVDLKYPEFAASEADEFLILDLCDPVSARTATEGVEEVYALAADMGGMGYISRYHATIMHNNSLIDLNTLKAAGEWRVRRFFYASTACVYPTYRQNISDVPPLREEDAYPADPDGGYGWEKLMVEQACKYYREEYGLQTRVARLHNIYGPLCTYDGGREKAPAAIARKVAEAGDGGVVQIWGDGLQTRSFCYVDDCVEGIYRLTQSDFPGPVNVGRDDLISIEGLAKMLIGIAGLSDVRIDHVPGPCGVQGRNSDNALVRRRLGWEPATDLITGMTQMYAWVAAQVRASLPQVSVLPGYQ